MSTGFEIRGEQGKVIGDLSEWERFGGPKHDYQWADGRSAKELARLWIERDGRELTERFLGEFPETRGFVSREALAEAETKLPFSGEGRNHDLLLVGDADAGAVTVGIEGKADETFGDPVSEHIAKALKRTERTKAPDRFDRLAEAIFGPGEWREELGDLRYQLFSGCAGAMVEAGEGGVAVFLVQVLESDRVDPDRVRANERDVIAFCERRGMRVRDAEAGWLSEPVHTFGVDAVPAGTLMVGKMTVTTSLG
ncbi:hypothetical protein HJD18_12470 [Thermoleophilia bacterium SCSIO 60948]|nr:hypothetical protein HJD18_12470 [Thermoleophilia bacterium SCSIO 60948]